MESDFGPQPFIFCNNFADRKQRVAKSKGEEQGSGDEQTPDAGEPDFEAVEPTKAADGLIEFSGNSVESARNIADAQVAQAKAELDELAKKAPMKGKIKLSGSPIAMIKQQKQADEIYKQQKAEHDQQLEAAQKRYTHWQNVFNEVKARQQTERQAKALAEDAERKRKKAELKAEQERGVEVVTGKQLENEILENKGKEAETSQDVSVYSLTADEAQDFISNMELSADEAPEIDLTIENWDALFGEGGIVNTPIGDVKMGENQFAKMMRQGRDGKLGMIKPTLESPYVIIEDASKAKDGDTTERASSYIFIRSFKKADGSRYYYFTSVTVSKDGKEVVVSSQEKSRKRILRLLQEGNVIWRTPKDATTISAKRQGLDYEQTDKAETATKGSGITPQSTPSESKGTNKSETLQGEKEKSEKGTQENPIDKINEHRATEGLEEVSEEEVALRDALNEQLKKSGIDVVTDSEGGQKILDMANDVRLSKDKKRALETASVTSDEAHQPTVVSSADGAKVLKNLDNLATEYEEKTGRPKTLLGDVAEAIGAEKHGSNSQYATFECKNGNVVTIRLANHNAAVSTFDNHGGSEGISIVVSPKKNAGVKKDGNAHVTEFFYDAILLRRAEGKPLAEIIRSIQQALYSGKFEDKTGLAQREEVNGDDIIRYHKVYHGSGADFDEFDHSHIGEGEGAQAFGWGTYLTEVKGIGEGYARKMEKSPKVRFLRAVLTDAKLRERRCEEDLIDAKETLLDRKNYAESLRQKYKSLKARAEQIKSEYGEKSVEYDNFLFNNDLDGAEKSYENTKIWVKKSESDLVFYEQNLKDAKQKVSEAQAAYDKETEGHKSVLYTVEAPDDNGKNFLHWESQTPSETVEKIRDYVREHCSEEVAEEFDKQIAYGTDNPDLAEYGQNGENVYKAVEYALDSDKKASLVLSELGMQGISYPADFMRGGRKDGARNYVIFKEEDAKITDKVRFFRTKNGKAYGFTVGGKIYVDPRIAKADTPIHEYSHLWASMFRDVNPKEWSNVVKLMKDTPLWEEIRKKYPELETDVEIADEVLAHFSGKRGAERLRQAQQEAMKEKGVSAKASAISAIERVRKALSTFWKGVCDLLHIHFTSAEEVADRVLSDMLNGVDPMKVKNEAKKEKGNLHYRMGDSTQTFAERQRKAVENRGTVMPGLNEAEVKVVEVPKHSYKGTIKEATERAIESAKAKYVPNGEPKILHYNNYGTSFDYEISKTAIQICLSPTHQSKSVNKGSHLALADHLDEIINNSIEVEEHPDYTKDDNGVRGNEINSNTLMHRFYGTVTIDGKQYRVMTLMRENQNSEENNGIHSYKVQTIEVLNNELPSTSNGVRSESITTIPSTSVTKLLQGVEKSYDKGKKLLDESKSLTDIKYRTSSEIDAEYPNWLEGTTNDNGKHTTQIAGTVKTYQKVGKWIESHLGKDIRILDASSGMGYGTADLKEQGFNIEDVEPYQSEDRKKNNPATYSSYGDIEGKYDYIISNAVLNVVPDDWRSDILHDMAARLNEGGKLFINTRKAGEEKSIKDKIELDSPQEVLVKRNGHIASYQKFSTPQELKEWVEKELGDGYTVEIANEENSGTKGLAAVVVTKTKATSATDPKSKTSRATEISEHLNTPVRVITSEKEMEGLSPRQKKAKGWYNTATGEVVVVVPNNADVADVENTVLHEVIGHDGIRDFRL